MSVTIGRLASTYHLAPGDRGSRERLDRIAAGELPQALAVVLAGGAVQGGELVAVRRLRAVARVRLSLADSAVAAAWGTAVGDALRAALDRGGPDVVRYRSRVAAVLDLLHRVARDDFDRVWAWRQFDLWQGSVWATRDDGRREALRLLTAEPERLLALLGAAARDSWFARWAARLPVEGWQDLAMVALGALRAAPVSALLARGEWSARRATPAAGAVMDRAAGLAASSPLAPIGLRMAEPAARTLLALLAVGAAEPGLARSTRIAELAVAVAATWSDEARARRASRAGSLPPGSLPPGASAPASGEGAPGRAAGAAITPSEPEPLDLPPPARTAFGGLLFLLHVVWELELADEIAAAMEGSAVAPAALRQRAFRWLLHGLGCTLVPAQEDDPAVLAFAGLPPDAVPPSRDEPPPSEAEQDWLHRMAERIAVRVAERLDRLDEPPGPVLDAVVTRPAEVVAEPGLLEIRLPLASVDPAVRRAGLDLDPGWVPWLGVWVRFVHV